MSEKYYFCNLSFVIQTCDCSFFFSEFVNKNAKSVIIQINLRDGRQVTLKIDIKIFHKLRYNVSLILKEMAHLKEMLA